MSRELMDAIIFIIIFQSMNSILTKGVLRGGGDVRMATLIDLVPLWVFALPLAALTGLVWEMGILWVYLSMMAENILKCVLGIARYRTGRWINDVTVTDPAA